MTYEELTPRGKSLFIAIQNFGWGDYSFYDVEYAIHDDEWEWAVDLADFLDKNRV